MLVDGGDNSLVSATELVLKLVKLCRHFFGIDFLNKCQIVSTCCHANRQVISGSFVRVAKRYFKHVYGSTHVNTNRSVLTINQKDILVLAGIDNGKLELIKKFRNSVGEIDKIHSNIHEMFLLGFRSILRQYCLNCKTPDDMEKILLYLKSIAVSCVQCEYIELYDTILTHLEYNLGILIPQYGTLTELKTDQIEKVEQYLELLSVIKRIQALGAGCTDFEEIKYFVKEKVSIFKNEQIFTLSLQERKNSLDPIIDEFRIFKEEIELIIEKKVTFNFKEANKKNKELIKVWEKIHEIINPSEKDLANLEFSNFDNMFKENLAKLEQICNKIVNINTKPDEYFDLIEKFKELKIKFKNDELN